MAGFLLVSRVRVVAGVVVELVMVDDSVQLVIVAENATLLAIEVEVTSY